MPTARLKPERPIADRRRAVPGGVASVPEGLPMVFPSSEIGSLADLLGNQTPHHTGGMVCPCCETPTRRVVRVRPGGGRRWMAACAMCAGKLLAGHPATLVGGHVRPRAKRAG